MAAMRRIESTARILRDLRALCAGFGEGSSPEAVRFRELWRNRIDLAYAVPRAALLPVLVLNQAVRHLAPEGTGYQRQAAANAVRVLARLGGPLDAGLWPAAEPDERAWLGWLCSRFADQETCAVVCSSPPWRPIANGCALLCAEPCDTEALRHFAVQTGPTAEPATPLAFLHRLVCLQLMHAYAEAGDWQQVLAWADAVGEDAAVLAAQAWCELGRRVAEVRDAARYRAYRARKLARRCHALGFEAEARRWEDDAAALQKIAGETTAGANQVVSEPGVTPDV